MVWEMLKIPYKIKIPPPSEGGSVGRGPEIFRTADGTRMLPPAAAWHRTEHEARKNPLLCWVYVVRSVAELRFEYAVLCC